LKFNKNWKMKNVLVLITMLAFSMNAMAQDALKTGDKAPAFSAKTDAGDSWNLSDHLGKKNIVIFFYPAAMTGGCTAQACSYRDQLESLESLGAAVVGISGDNVEALKVFKKAHNLNYPLLSDFDGAIAAKFGVPTGAGGSLTRVVDDSEFVLTRGVTAQRWTFIIGKDGNIKYINQQVNAQNDSKQVIEILSQK
jgi:thioredoxin-dependent peroxiredoxin